MQEVLPEDGGKLINEMKQLLRQVLIAPPIEDYVVRLVHATQPQPQNVAKLAGAAIPALWLEPARRAVGYSGSKRSRSGGRSSSRQLRRRGEVLYPALRHRIILNFQAEAENVSADQIMAEVVKQVRRN